MRCPFRGEYVRDVSSDGADWRVPPLYGRRNEDNMGYPKGIGAYNGGPSNPKTCTTSKRSYREKGPLEKGRLKWHGHLEATTHWSHLDSTPGHRYATALTTWIGTRHATGGGST